MNLICIKEFEYCRVGKSYEYWTNFGGLNHFIRRENNSAFPFSGPTDFEEVEYTGDVIVPKRDDRPYIFEYFCTLDEYRDKQINEVLNDL
jgi:hypothetical protein